MRKIIQNGETDFSDEGEQARNITNEIEVNHFYSKLSPRQQRVMTYLLAGETLETIARFLGVNLKTIKREKDKIGRLWLKYK